MTKYTPPKDITILRASDIPAGTTEIDLSSNTNITTIEGMPDSVTGLNLYGCTKLGKFPTWPKGLTRLKIGGYPLLEKIEIELPATLKILDIETCLVLSELPSLPDGLSELNVSNSLTGLRALPTPLPSNLNSLNIKYCPNLRSLPPLPAGITSITLKDCHSLMVLPELPPILTTLNARNCRLLATLPPLPERLTNLNLLGCTSLTNTAELIRQLLNLEERNRNNSNFRLSWPEHINRFDETVLIMQSLATAYRNYYRGTELGDKEPTVGDLESESNYPVLVLFHRFLTESVEQRGGIEKLTGPASGVIGCIERSPQILEFLNESARGFLAACVNQPTAGFTEISCLVAMSEQPTVEAKLDLARVLMAVNLISDKVRSLMEGVGAGVQVELGNAILMEVHKKLLQEGVITAPWPGIPDGVAYQEFVEPFLTLENINESAEQVKKDVLAAPMSQVANHVCDHPALQDIWAYFVVTKEERAEAGKECAELKQRMAEAEEVTEELAQELKDAELRQRELILTLSKAKTLAAITPTAERAPEEPQEHLASETHVEQPVAEARQEQPPAPSEEPQQPEPSVAPALALNPAAVVIEAAPNEAPAEQPAPEASRGQQTHASPNPELPLPPPRLHVDSNPAAAAPEARHVSQPAASGRPEGEPGRSPGTDSFMSLLSSCVDAFRRCLGRR